jgi:hypothetical protein
MDTITPGTRVMLQDAVGDGYGPWCGRIVVCLCKRHTWQPALLGCECKHGDCGYPRRASACPWPYHVRWEGDDNESHQGPESLVITDPTLRPVPRCSGEAAIYSPEYLRRTQGPRDSSTPYDWRSYVP